MPRQIDTTKLRSRAHDIRRTLLLVWHVAPLWTSANLALVAVQGLLPLAGLYLMKKVVDTVTAAVKTGATDPAARQLMIWIALTGAVALLLALCRMLANIVSEAQSFLVTQEMSDLIHRQSIRLDLAHYENPATRDMMHRAQEEAPFRPLAILTSITQIGQAAISLIGIAGLLLTYNIPVTLVLLLCAIPGAALRLFFSRRMRDLARRQTQDKRLSEYFHYSLILERAAKEMKLFQLGHLFRERYREIESRLRTGRLGLFRQRETADFAGQTIAAVALFASLGYVALSALRGVIGLGAMVMYYQAFQTGLAQLQTLLRSGANLLEHRLFLENFYQFLDLQPTVIAHEPVQALPIKGTGARVRADREQGIGNAKSIPAKNSDYDYEDEDEHEDNEAVTSNLKPKTSSPEPIPSNSGTLELSNSGTSPSSDYKNYKNDKNDKSDRIPSNSGTQEPSNSGNSESPDYKNDKNYENEDKNEISRTVRFENVSFQYPGRSDFALTGINLEIRPGQVIALVGPNGSGKTTIAKLIPRLYDPTSGTITVDGIDLRHVEPEEWRRQVSVVFQDFLQYPLSVRDNIWLGDISRPPDPDLVRRAAQSSGAHGLIARLMHAYDTTLGNEYNGGHQLSGGEWQKIAVARAFFREAPLAILDEPSSALDPRAESELFSRFRTLIAGKSAVLISHRFSTVQMADYIYVLDEGRITEQGTHQDLLRLDGTYAQLYYVQAEKFLGAPPRDSKSQPDEELPRAEEIL